MTRYQRYNHEKLIESFLEDIIIKRLNSEII